MAITAGRPARVAAAGDLGGLPKRSYVTREEAHALWVGGLLEDPLRKRYGVVSEPVMRDVEDRLRIILEL